MKSAIQKIETEGAPRAVGPYSQGIVVSGSHQMIYVSGQLPIDPNTGKLIEGDIQTLTRRVLENMKAILIAGGSNLENVIRVEVFLTDVVKDFPGMNEEYAKYFCASIKPARQTVGVAKLAMGATIEISCIAYVH
jgi:2-iminobutanoate/2-iminopropanoate deaminase